MQKSDTKTRNKSDNENAVDDFLGIQLEFTSRIYSKAIIFLKFDWKYDNLHYLDTVGQIITEFDDGDKTLTQCGTGFLQK